MHAFYSAKPFLVVLLGFFCVLNIASAQRRGESSRRAAEQTTLQRILNPNTYDKSINPGGNNTNGPVEIAIEIYARTIFEINEAKNEMGIQITLRQYWNDPRLVYNARVGSDDLKFVTVQDINKIWRADIFVANAKEENLNDFNKPNAFARIYPNGDVLLSERVTLQIFCPMNFRSFPFDTQTCKIRLASYSALNSEILLTWKAENPLQANTDLGSQPFKLISFETDRCDANTTTGTYSCVRSLFHFRRHREHYLIQLFIPCTMLFIVAYLVFWLEPNNLIVRVLISLATLFVAATQISRFNENLPKTSYTKAVDHFTGIVLTFIFATLIETIVVYKMSQGEEAGPDATETAGESGPEDPEAENLKPEAEGAGETGKKKVLKLRNYLARIRRRSEKIDVLCRIIYPIAFFLFAIIFYALAAL